MMLSVLPDLPEERHQETVYMILAAPTSFIYCVHTGSYRFIQANVCVQLFTAAASRLLHGCGRKHLTEISPRSIAKKCIDLTDTIYGQMVLLCRNIAPVHHEEMYKPDGYDLWPDGPESLPSGIIRGRQ